MQGLEFPRTMVDARLIKVGFVGFQGFLPSVLQEADM